MNRNRRRIALGLSFFPFCCFALISIATAQPAPSPARESLQRRVSEALRAFDYAAAVEPGEAFIALYEKEKRTHDSAYLYMLIKMAHVQQSLEDYPKADEFFDKAYAVVQAQKDKEAEFLAPVLNGLGMNQIYQLKFEKARDYLTQGLREVKKRRGAFHPNTAHQHLSLAMACNNLGDLRTAELHYLTALRIYTMRLGARHSRTAAAYRELGNFFGNNGDYDKAIDYLNKAYQIFRTRPNQHDMVATLFLQLGKFHRRKKDYDTAVAFYNKAKALLVKKFGADSPKVSNVDAFLGTVYCDQGKYSLALEYHQKVAARLNRSENPNRITHATAYNNLGYDELLMSRPVDARKHLRKSLAMWKAILPENHLYVANTMTSLAMVESIHGNKTQGTKMLASAAGKYHVALDQLMNSGSEASKLAFLERLRGKTHFSIDNHLRFNPKSRTAAEHAFDVILNRKGRVLDALSRHQQAFAETLSRRQKKWLEQLRVTRRTLSAQLTWSTFTGQRADQAGVKAIRAKIESLERTVSRWIPAHMMAQEKPTLEKVAKRLPKESALLEFFIYTPFNPKIPSAQEHLRPKRLAVYLVFPDGRLRWADLGELKNIRDAITIFRTRLQNKKPIEKEAVALYSLIVRPIAGDLKRVKTLIIAPDGMLNLLPFAALQDKPGRYLLKSYQISYLNCARELLRPRDPSKRSGDLVIVANPEYGQPGLPFTKLPGTAQEAELLAKLIPSAKVFVGDEAREDLVKQLPPPKVLHIATHGFFAGTASPPSQSGTLPNKKPANDDNKTARPYQASPAKRMRNPMARSGLALVGANRLRNANEDGILTALEVTSMNLHGTELVVLSACETGIGEIHAGEGAFGLRRALVVAGSQSQVMSLWNVGDDSTKELMGYFYGGLIKAKGRSEAMRAAQQRLLKGKYGHPYYWAPFILSGEWARLSPKKAIRKR